MSTFEWFLLLVCLAFVGVAFSHVRESRRATRSKFMAELLEGCRELGRVVGAQGGDSQLMDVRDGKIILDVGGAQVEVPALRLLEIMKNENVPHRRNQLRLLLDRSVSC